MTLSLRSRHAPRDERVASHITGEQSARHVERDGYVKDKQASRLFYGYVRTALRRPLPECRLSDAHTK